VEGITDTDGGWGGGTVSHVNVTTLVSTDFKTTGGAAYKMPANYPGFLEGFSSDNIAARNIVARAIQQLSQGGQQAQELGP
jgi:hypothetical protein